MKNRSNYLRTAEKKTISSVSAQIIEERFIHLYMYVWKYWLAANYYNSSF